MHLTECQLDELWIFVYKKEERLTAFEKLAQRYGDTWIWTAFDPVSKLVPAWRIGKRTLVEAHGFVKTLKSRLDAHLPFFASDDLPHYADALLVAYGVKVTPSWRFPHSRPPSPYLKAPPDLVYAVVIKNRTYTRVGLDFTTMLYVVPAQALGQKHFQHMPNQLLAREPKKPLGLVIYENDVSVVVDDDDRIRHRFKQNLEPVESFEKACPLTLRFRHRANHGFSVPYRGQLRFGLS